MPPTNEEDKQIVRRSPENSIGEKRDTASPSNESKTREIDANPADNWADRYLKPSRRAFMRAGALAVGFTASSGQVSARGHNGNGQVQEIDSCTEITESGRYVLTEDLEASGGVCLAINADDVLLDGAGHTIFGSSRPTGIDVGEYPGPGFSNVTIENLTITGFFIGIYFGGMFDSQIRNVTVEQCRYGLWFDESTDNDIRENEFSNNDTGIHITEASSSNVLRSNTVTDNGRGIGINDASTDTHLIGNMVTNNARSGIDIANFSNDCRLIDNVSKNNGGNGFEITDDVTNVRLQGNLAQSNGENGIFLLWANENKLIRNTANQNDDHGIELDDSHDNLLIRNELCGNGGESISEIGGSSGNKLRANVTNC